MCICVWERKRSRQAAKRQITDRRIFGHSPRTRSLNIFVSKGGWKITSTFSWTRANCIHFICSFCFVGVATWHGESTILHVYSRKLSTHIHLATIQSLSSFYGPGGGYNLCHKVVAFQHFPTFHQVPRQHTQKNEIWWLWEQRTIACGSWYSARPEESLWLFVPSCSKA